MSATRESGTGPGLCRYNGMRKNIAMICALAAAMSLGAQATRADDAGDNELAFNGHCRECHAFDKGDNRLGPSLYGVVGRKAGTAPNFAYSDAVKNSGITWDEATLDKWITNPNSVIPGNNMGTVFSGVSDAAIRKKIIAFLKSDTNLPKK